jgi:hypothetical protein
MANKMYHLILDFTQGNGDKPHATVFRIDNLKDSVLIYQAGTQPLITFRHKDDDNEN